VSSSSEEALKAIVGESPVIRRLKTYLPKIAATHSSVLICGETGTGKELVAGAIHQLSSRSGERLVYVNCAALPDGLLESELFGYERGAFTGAYTRSEGLLKQADGGTVVLDEIGDMNPVMQAKLLRVLEARQVQRLGARSTESLNVRFIAATNQNLESLMTQGRFRRDLFYRLNVVRLDLPALRTRREDVPLLVEYFMSKLLDSVRPPPPVEQRAIECLMRYDWPGNIRELRNVLECLCADLPPIITLEDLPPAIGRLSPEAQSRALNERELLLSALLSTNWNKTKAAEQLHWSRMTLYRKLHKYDIGIDR
jgi:transcriptional regulator with PAS, ATPase and Fis domain